MLGQETSLHDIFCSWYVFFSFLYIGVFNPTETADNLKKYDCSGIRPGERTTLFIENLLTKLTLLGLPI